MILKILLTLIFSSTLIIIVLKIFSSAFLPLKMNRISKFVNSKTQYSGEKATFKECLGIALGALGFRLFIYLISCIIIIYLLDNGEIFNFKTFLQEWEKWDATNYIRIADGWYTGHVENGDYTTLAFFPLYPILMRIVDLLVKNMQLSGLIVSTLCFSIACPFLYALVALDYGKSAAKKVVVLLTVFPFSFFFGSMMSESTFLMMTVITLYFIRTHKWGLVALFGALSGLSRLAGVIIIIPAFIEWFEYYKPLELIRRKKWKCFWNVVCTKGLVIFLVLAGTLGYLYINYSITGKPFAFMEYQSKYWFHENCFFIETITDIFGKALNPNTSAMMNVSVWIPSAAIFALAIGLLVYASRKHKGMYTLYMAAYIVVNCSVTWLISGARYMTACVPMFVILGALLDKKEKTYRSITIISSVLMGIYFVGYMMSKQIM